MKRTAVILFAVVGTEADCIIVHPFLREPSQVFTLLESIYRAFDSLAERRRVFKVETVGDSYVGELMIDRVPCTSLNGNILINCSALGKSAVAGLPDKRPDHAVVSHLPCLSHP